MAVEALVHGNNVQTTQMNIIISVSIVMPAER